MNDNAAAPGRTTVRIPTASGDGLEAWLYLPEGDGPYPAVVLRVELEFLHGHASTPAP